MTESINEFLSLPLWFTIPLVVSYIAVVAYVIYAVWHIRKRQTQNNK